MRLLKLGALSLAAALCLNAQTLAVVDGEKITDEDVKQILKQMPGASYEKLPEEMKKKVVEQAVDRELLSKNALKEGITKSSDYKAQLKEIEESLALEVWMKKEFDDVSVSEKELKKFYEENKERFAEPKQVKASHILVKTEDEAKQIIDTLESAKDLDARFAKLAKEKSTGPSGKNGGELGWFGEGQMVPDFSDAAFALGKGEFTKEPVQTRFGYHVIYVEDKKDASKRSFEDVKGQLEQNLKVKKFQEKVSALANKLKADAKVEYKID